MHIHFLLVYNANPIFMFDYLDNTNLIHYTLQVEIYTVEIIMQIEIKTCLCLYNVLMIIIDNCYCHSTLMFKLPHL